MKLIHSVLALGLALGLGSGAMNAQDQKHPSSAKVNGTKSRGENTGKDENIKNDRAPNDPNAKIEAPADKGGPKTRQASCRVHVDNHTGYLISIYTDGNYRGEVSSFGDSIGFVGCGDTTLYAKARFSDMDITTWGPKSYYINGTFTWQLY
jgi:hypothetical protein